MKKFLGILLSALMLLASISFAGCGSKVDVMIYTSTEDYTIEYMGNCFKEVFPDYNIQIEYMGTSDIAAKVLNEGTSSDCDIIFGEEYGYVEKLKEAGVLADLSSMYDYSVFTEESLNTSAKDYLLPSLKTGGAVIINNKVLTDRGIAKPTSYADLLDAKYQGLVSMPSPKSSGTGYMFYLSLVNEMGEQEALTYFNNLTPNIQAYTSSGSGPVNKLKQREVAVGFGMISQAVDAINTGSTELEILVFDEGSPFNLYGTSIVKGKENNEKVKAVMDYFYSTFIDAVDERYYPEPVLKNKSYSVTNYPAGIDYSDMSNNTLSRKEGLLAKWSH